MDKSFEKLPVVILGGSDEVIFGIVRSLKQRRIPVIVITWDKYSIFLFSRFVKKAIKAADPISDETNFISFLCQYGDKMHQEYGTRILLFPSADTSLMLIAKYYAELKRYYVMLGDPNENDLQKFIRKDLFFEQMQDLGIPLPKTLSCVEEKNIENVADGMVYPCIVKPAEKDLSFSFYHRYKAKAAIARNKSELEKLLKENNEKSTKLLVQELIPGDTTREFSWCGYRSKDGKFIRGIVGQMGRKPPYQTATFVIRKEAKELIEHSQKILNDLNFWGICEIEYKNDPRDGLFKLIEMNPRCCMWFYLATACGLNLPYIVYREVYYDELPKNNQTKQEMKWVLLKQDFINTVLRDKDRKLFRKLHLWFSNLKGERVYAMFDSSDPLVVSAYWANMLISGVSGFAGKYLRLFGRAFWKEKIY